eukprot:SAG11_NODE_835_length_6927_cov_2.877142_10_plen_136_part_00
MSGTGYHDAYRDSELLILVSSPNGAAGGNGSGCMFVGRYARMRAPSYALMRTLGVLSSDCCPFMTGTGTGQQLHPSSVAHSLLTNVDASNLQDHVEAMTVLPVQPLTVVLLPMIGLRVQMPLNLGRTARPYRARL